MWAQIASTIFMIFRLLISRRGAARLCDMFADVVVEFDDGESVKQDGVMQVGLANSSEKSTEIYQHLTEIVQVLYSHHPN